MLKGKKTYIAALTIAFTPEIVQAALGVDWQTLGLSPHAAGVIAVIMTFLRTITTGPAFVLVKTMAPVVAPTDDAK